MKASELRAKDTAALEKEVGDLLKAHFGLRMQKATQQLTNHSQLGSLRSLGRGRDFLLLTCCHGVLLDQAPSWRATKVVRSGSLAAARRKASRASSSGTPTIS